MSVLLSFEKLLLKFSYDFNLGFFPPFFYKICQNQGNIFESVFRNKTQLLFST